MTDPKDNLFSYATNELSGSAFWTWLLISLCGEDKGTERYKIAVKFMEKIGLKDVPLGHVHKEVKIEGAGRADIVLYSDKYDESKPEKHIIAVIENKTWSTVLAKSLKTQIDSYIDGIKEWSPNAKPIVMTFRYDTERQWKKPPRSNSNYSFLGLNEQFDILGINKTKESEIINHYTQHIQSIRESRKKRLKKLSIGSLLSNLTNGELEHHDTQWKLMEVFTENCENGYKSSQKGSLDIDNGNSRGRPWTQAGFNIADKRFFYRLDKDNKGYYLRLNQYDHEYPKSLNKFREQACNICKEPIEKACENLNPIILKIDYSNPKYINSNECTFWYLRFSDNKEATINDVTSFLEAFHRKFVTAMKTFET